ncbi:MAG: PQQ-binding-like beta-propeller repeat protein [Chloroflexota bacterium]
MLAAKSGVVCFIGAMNNNAPFSLICLNGHSGDFLWQKYSSSLGDILIEDGVYVTRSGMAGVARYGLDGSLSWSRPIRGPGIIYMFFVDEQLQVFTALDKLISIDPHNGETLFEFSNGHAVFIYTQDRYYVEDNGLQVIDSRTNTILWHRDLDDTLTLAPLFLDDRIYLRTGRTMGSIYAIDRTSGEVLWKTDDNIISNMAYSPSDLLVFCLTRDGYLLAIDRDSGQEFVLGEFSSVPFIINGEDDVGGYELAFDDSTNMLFVLLGDSRQLFAFQMK